MAGAADLSDYLAHYSEADGFAASPSPAQASPSPLHADASTPFATEETYAACCEFLDSALALAGFPTPLRVGPDASPADRVRAVNVVYALFKGRRRAAEEREAAREETARLVEEVRHLRERNEQLRDAVKAAEKQKWELEMRRRVEEADARKTEGRLRAELQAVQKRCVMVQHRDRQFTHELRKREKEYTRLQERLQRLLSDRGKDSRAGMDVLNRLKGRPGGGGGRARKADEELLRQTIGAYEERLADVIGENADLRKSLAGLNRELQDALNSGGARGGDRSSRSPPMSPDTQGALDDFNAEAQFDMPFSFVRDKVEGGLRAKMRMLRDKMAELREQEARGVSASDAQLRARVEEQDRIIREQDRLLSESVKGRSATGHADSERLLEESRRWSDAAELEAQRHALREQQRMHTQSAEDMDRRRRQLEEERAALDQERRALAARFGDADFGRVPSGGRGRGGGAAASAARNARVAALTMPQTPAGVNLDDSFGSASPVQRMEISDDRRGVRVTTIGGGDDDGDAGDDSDGAVY